MANGQEMILLVRKVLNSHFCRYGLPFIILVVGSSFLATTFQEVKYEARKKKYNNELLQKAGFKKVSLQEEYEKMKEMDTSNYQNVRGPRPWEDNKEWLNNRAIQERRMEELRREAEEKRAAKLREQQRIEINPS